jgi:hypothetical protein
MKVIPSVVGLCLELLTERNADQTHRQIGHGLTVLIDDITLDDPSLAIRRSTQAHPKKNRD